jgi:hypothetical protein
MTALALLGAYRANPDRIHSLLLNTLIRHAPGPVCVSVVSRSSAVVGLAKPRDNRTRPVAILVALVHAPPRKVQIASRFGVHGTQLDPIEGVSSSAR